MPTPLINNFSINVNAPIDDRLSASNSTDRDAIDYKYDGMQVFTIDSGITWVYDETGATWSSLLTSSGNTNGIYGGSGSLTGNVYINSGEISPTIIDSNSYKLIVSGSSSNKVYYSSFFRRHTSTGDWSGIEYRTQFNYDINTSSNSYIAYNTYDSTSNAYGGIDFGTSNKKQISITSDGIFRSFAAIEAEDYVIVNYNPTHSTDADMNSFIIRKTMTYSSIAMSVENVSSNIYSDNYMYTDTLGFLVLGNQQITNGYFRNIISLGNTNFQLIDSLYGRNPISAIHISQKSDAHHSGGSINGLAGLRIDGYTPNAGSSIVSFGSSNYYGLLINPSYEISGNSSDPYYQAGYNRVIFQNKYGIYQVSPYDKNYFGGKVGIGTAPDEGFNLIVGGTVSFTSATWSTSGLTNWINDGTYVAVKHTSSGTFNEVSYMRFNNMVYLSGVVLYTYNAGGTKAMFKLPAHVRPSKRTIINPYVSSSANFGNCFVEPDGSVFTYTFGAGLAYIYLDGVSFRLN